MFYSYVVCKQGRWKKSCRHLFTPSWNSRYVQVMTREFSLKLKEANILRWGEHNLPKFSKLLPHKIRVTRESLSQKVPPTFWIACFQTIETPPNLNLNGLGVNFGRDVQFILIYADPSYQTPQWIKKSFNCAESVQYIYSNNSKGVCVIAAVITIEWGVPLSWKKGRKSFRRECELYKRRQKRWNNSDNGCSTHWDMSKIRRSKLVPEYIASISTSTYNQNGYRYANVYSMNAWVPNKVSCSKRYHKRYKKGA